MLAIVADEILHNHNEIELQLFSLWCIIYCWLVPRSFSSLIYEGCKEPCCITRIKEPNSGYGKFNTLQECEAYKLVHKNFEQT